MQDLFSNNNEANCHISTGNAYNLVQTGSTSAWSDSKLTINDDSNRLSTAYMTFDCTAYAGVDDIAWRVEYNTYYQSKKYHRVEV